MAPKCRSVAGNCALEGWERSLCGLGEVDAIALVIKLRETLMVSGDGYTKIFCSS
jgi:hypothetical protein